MVPNKHAGVSILALAIAAFLLSITGGVDMAGAASGPVMAHTSGMVSRAAAIRVVFSVEPGAGAEFSKPLKTSPFEFRPAITGEAVWVNARTLEFRQREELAPGTKYAATLHLSDIMEVTGGMPDIVTFDFTVVPQAMEIVMDGLQSADPKNPRRQRFGGTITTADVADAERVEKVVAVSLGGRAVPLSWEHSEDRKTHRFRTRELLRADSDTPLLLTWDGAPIDAAQKGRREVMLPAAETFDVLFARPIQGVEQRVDIQMTDPLDRGQDLRGLVTVEGEGEDLRTDINGSRLSVYLPESRWGDVSVRLNAAIRNTAGRRLGEDKTVTVYFGEIKPQARFIGKAAVMPTTHGLTVPVETANLRRLTVSAMRIPTDNLPQFLQVNNLDESEEVKRVGRVIWKRTIDLNWQPEMKNRWVRHGLDLTELVRRHPGGMFRLILSFTYRDVDYGCVGDEDRSAIFNTVPAAEDNADAESENSYWNNVAQTGGYDNWYTFYQNRENPCHPAYYMPISGHDITASRNVLISDIGLLAKRGDGADLLVVATDIRTATPLAGVSVDVLNYQQEVLASGVTNNRGIAALKTEAVPFLAVARHQGQWGYLKLDDGSANALSHFDVAGVAVKKGLKGFLYGERGVWRPGDTLHLTFILDAGQQHLPADHPVRFELLNPRGQMVRTMIRTNSLNGFYDFTTATAEDAPTGNWVGRVTVGGATFEKTLKIETVMPNRLKINLDFGTETPVLKAGPISGTLHSRWLHGAPANGLKATMEMSLQAGTTRFPAYEAYTFDDPVRRFRQEKFEIFDGTLDAQGDAGFSADINAENDAPGRLTASFHTRVFEPSGAFSTDVFNVPFDPYERYVGVRLPKGDAARGMLLTDTDHRVDIAMVDADGKPVGKGRVQVDVYKLKWRWWWEKGAEDLADYVGSTDYEAIDTDEVDIKDGKGTSRLRINYPEWGRYLVRVSDMDGRHITGRIVYVDWPGWAGRGQKESPGGAAVLSFSADKPEYKVGEEIVLTIPAGRKGRALVSIEKGARVLITDWVEGGEAPIRYAFTATPEMAPNVYAHVTYLQPHLEAGNDLPIRLYGVIPVPVVDPQTRLSPVVGTPETFVPEAAATVTVSEAAGRPMTYTLAIVDEGLLDLTRFSTPDPWSQFYQREALGVKTWDLFDAVAGAYGGMLEQMLAIGGGAPADDGGEKKAKRFPPMVRFAGPFFLAAGATDTHTIDFPQYIGSVRVMVVAGGAGSAYGFADKAVPVKKPLMVLGTLPRVISPDEDIALPVSVFALDAAIKEATVNVEAEGALAVVGEASHQVVFPAVGDQLVNFRLQAASAPGHGVVKISAAAGGERAAQRIDIDVRSITVPETTITVGEIRPGATWRPEVALPGVAGTNSLALEVATLPTMQLGRRLDYLVKYPHGCLEQTVSTAFPQLYLNRLLAQSPRQRDRAAENVQAAIEKLNRFLSPGGGFVYWPGGRHANAWADIYTGHFLIEAQKAGYLVPAHLKQSWTGYNRRAARNWVAGDPQAALVQAYRLYVLALAGAPEMGAMNRLREDTGISTAARWRLAAAYAVMGQSEAADDLTARLKTTVDHYTELSGTFGSALRDEAMILEALCLMDRRGDSDALARKVRAELGGQVWYGTQTTAFALIAVARYAGLSGAPPLVSFAYKWGNAPEKTVAERQPVVQEAIDASLLEAGGAMVVTNTGKQTLYAQLSATGSPPPGKETAAASGLSLEVHYLSQTGNPIAVERLAQGTDLVVAVRVKNTGGAGDYKNLALTHLFPAGWEIRNTRLTESGKPDDSDKTDYRDIRDDRILAYFDLAQGEEIRLETPVNASYIGRYYLPSVRVEAMYDNRINARQPGRWIEVVAP